MKIIKKNKKGLALVEVIFGISIIMLASIIFASVVRDTFQASKTSRDFLIAQNLAEEGAEALEIIIHSNELILGAANNGTQNQCWFYGDPNAQEFEFCQPADPKILAPGSYIPWFNLQQGRWKLFEVPDLTLNLKERLENEEDIAVLQPFLVHENNDQAIAIGYLHSPQDPEGYPSATFDVSPTKFYRSVEINTVHNLWIAADAVVQWTSAGQVFEVRIPVTINNPFN